MKKTLTAASAALALILAACNDDLSPIGGSLSQGEVTITVDSLTTNLLSETESYDKFDGRNLTKLLGRINVPEFGSLDCSFVAQMMCAQSMNVPDSITTAELDSMRFILSVPRGSLTGDSLTPQQLTLYRLDRELPADISSTFSPDGYYNPSDPMGVKSYTLSNISKGDSALKRDAYVRIPVPVSLDFGTQLFQMYRDNDPVFAWPATFNKFFPGIYVQQNFGNGCIANISKAEFFTYWHRNKQEYVQEDSVWVWKDRIHRDSVCLLASQPEVLSSNIIDYRMSDYIKGMAAAGKRVVTTPGGYMASIAFPVNDLIDRYRSKSGAMATVSSLKLEIPAEAIENDYGLQAAPWLLMVRKSDYADFLAQNKLPDDSESFYAAYDSEHRCYRFNSMRKYFLEMLEMADNGETPGEKETEFMLVPVKITSESVTNYDGSVTVYVTKCQPYLDKPTMTHLHTDRALITFTFSTQEIY